MTFLDSLAVTTNRTRTENAGATNKSSLSATLDFFALGGAMRGRPDEFLRLFRLAYAEDRQLALRTLFYIRDIRGGQGERDLFRRGLAELRRLDEDTWVDNFALVPHFGRWDDLLTGELTPEILDFVDDVLATDIHMFNNPGASISLLAKWLPSENASSKETKARAKKIREYLGLSSRDYRLALSDLRKHISLLEQKMSAKQWEQIDYSKLPSQALRKHVKAFRRNDPVGYSAFLEAVESGEKKINTSTLYTYEVYNTLFKDQATANVMWDNLPDYTNGTPALVMADVSGSMTWVGPPTPLSVSVSLALYFAERNLGPFNGYFMTFSAQPELVKVVGNNLAEKFMNIRHAEWFGNTDLEAAFDAILKAAVNAEAAQEEMPAVLYIISDMEFDQCVRADESVLQAARRKFAEAGYKLPHVVFWNVAARNTHVPATKFDGGVTLVSGFSQTTFRYAVEGKTPEESMREILNSERYQSLVPA